MSLTPALLAANVNDHTEKKDRLTYLSWAWAWTEVLKADPAATWEPMNFGPADDFRLLLSMPDGTAFVGARVTIGGIARQCLLPVMDHRNKAIPKPNSFDVNKALMRCLAKAVAMHGLGLYIYAGEDLPEADDEPVTPQPEPQRAPHISATSDAGSSLSEARRSELDAAALFMIEEHQGGRDVAAINFWYDPGTFAEDDDPNDARMYLWNNLRAEAKLRATIKASNPKASAKAKAA